MASGAEIAGAAGGAAQIIPALIGRGKSNYNAQDISHSGMYDPFAHQFGNYGAENYAVGREQQANAIDRRSAPQANYMQADMDRQRALQARASQATVMNQLMARAAGQTPSIAQMQADRQMGQASAQQAALQASARGRGALGNAATTAASNTANAHGAISNQAQINAANERMQAEQAAFGAASGMRNQDQTSEGLAAQREQFNVGMQMTNRQTNDARAVATQQMGHQALGQESTNRVNMQGIGAQSHAAAQAQNAETERRNAGSKGLIESVGDFFSSDVSTKMPYVTSDFSAKQPFALVAGGGMNPVSAPAEASFDKLTPGGGGMDVMGSLEKHSNFATQFQRDPTGGMGGGAMMVSDARAKKEAFEAGVQYADTVRDAKTRADLPEYMQEPKKSAETGREIRAVDRDEPGRNTRPQTGVRQKIVDPDSPTGWRYAEQQDPAPPHYVESDSPMQREGRSQLMPRQSVSFVRDPRPSAPSPAVTVPDVRTMVSDFNAKQGLTRDAFGSPAEGDPNAPRFAYRPGQGWVDASKEPTYSQDLDAAMRGEAEQPGHWSDDAYWKKQVADNDRKIAQRAEWAKDDEPKAADGKTMAPGTADFQKTEPKPQADGATKPWWMALGEAGRGLNEAQFGSDVKSDRRAKNVIDLDEVDIDNDPGAQDFDADEYDAKLADKLKPYDRREFKRDTPADQKAVKRAYEDKAGKDADAMMANMRAGLDKGSSVQDRVAASRLGPSDSPVAEANRTMHGQMYTYKPQYTPPEQAPGEPNFGFMAQNLEKSPITATAVKEDPNGLKRVDALKLLRLLGASVADLQEQQDETRLALSKGGKR